MHRLNYLKNLKHITFNFIMFKIIYNLYYNKLWNMNNLYVKYFLSSMSKIEIYFCCIWIVNQWNRVVTINFFLNEKVF